MNVRWTRTSRVSLKINDTVRECRRQADLSFTPPAEGAHRGKWHGKLACGAEHQVTRDGFAYAVRLRCIQRPREWIKLEGDDPYCSAQDVVQRLQDVVERGGTIGSPAAVKGKPASLEASLTSAGDKAWVRDRALEQTASGTIYVHERHVASLRTTAERANGAGGSSAGKRKRE